MDDIVRQAMAKWPHVPDCYGWLGLDTRGNWYMRDDRAQAAGAFASGVREAKGSRLQHEKLIDFIGRNYAADSAGNWYFQNGPQRVYVELEATPWIWRMTQALAVSAHTGTAVQPLRCMQDEKGWVYLLTNLGFGLLYSQDVPYAAEALEQGVWELEIVRSEELPKAFAYVQSPQAKK